MKFSLLQFAAASAAGVLIRGSEGRIFPGALLTLQIAISSTRGIIVAAGSLARWAGNDCEPRMLVIRLPRAASVTTGKNGPAVDRSDRR